MTKCIPLAMSTERGYTDYSIRPGGISNTSVDNVSLQHTLGQCSVPGARSPVSLSLVLGNALSLESTHFPSAVYRVSGLLSLALSTLSLVRE
jgi:hypothetical protein